MNSSRSSVHLLAPAILALPLILGSTIAFAGKTQIEFNGTPGSSSPFGSAGDAWVANTGTGNPLTCAATGPASCGVAFTNGASSAAILLGFDAQIDGTTYNSVFINSSGLLTFGSGYSAGFSPSLTTVADLQTAIGTPFIAAVYADLGIGSVIPGSFAPFGGGASFFRATAIPTVTSASTAADLKPAFAATWFSNTGGVDPLDPQVATQLVLYSTNSSGDFAVRLRYGSQSDLGDVTYTGALSGYSLGSDVKTATNPSSTIDYVASFVGGAFTFGTGFADSGGGGTIGVPEMDPTSAASGLTLLLGTLTVLLSRRRVVRQIAS